MQLQREIGDRRGVRWAPGTIVSAEIGLKKTVGKTEAFLRIVAPEACGPVLCDEDWKLVVPDTMEVK